MKDLSYLRSLDLFRFFISAKFIDFVALTIGRSVRECRFREGCSTIGLENGMAKNFSGSGRLKSKSCIFN